MTDRRLAVPVIQAEIRAKAEEHDPAFWAELERVFAIEPFPTLVERLR